MKPIATVLHMYSNSPLSQSVQTPKSAVINTSLLFTSASGFGNTQVGLGLFHHATVSQMIQLKCEKMIKEMWNEDPSPKQACRSI